MLDKTLLFKAADAAQGITAAQAAIEDAKRAVEEAKASVETAKAGLVDAKAAYDSVVAEFVASGVPAAKVKRNVEDFLRILGDLGYVDPAEDTPAIAEPKATRRKKSEQSAPPADVVEGVAKLAEAGEPGVIVVQPENAAAEEQAVASDPALADGSTTETVGVAVDDETTDTGDDAVSAEPAVDESVMEQVEAPVEEAAVAPASDEESGAAQEVEAVSYDIDNSEAFAEILDLIETVCPNVHESVSEMLVTMLNAADWFSREWEKQPLDVQFYRDILNMEFVVSALKQPMSDELHAALGAVRDAGNADEVFEWFAASLDRVESGAEPLPFSRRADGTTQGDPVEVVTDPQDTGVEVSDEADADEAVSDDVTLVGETVEDIGEINFLEEAAAAFAGAKIETTAPAEPSKPTAEEEAKPAAPRSFRPRFMSSKDA